MLAITKACQFMDLKPAMLSDTPGIAFPRTWSTTHTHTHAHVHTHTETRPL